MRNESGQAKPYDGTMRGRKNGFSFRVDGDGASRDALPVSVVIGALSGMALLGLLWLIGLPEKQTLWTTSARAVSYTAASGAAGAAVIAMLWAAMRPKTVSTPAVFVQAAAEACVFLPCLTILQMKRSPWMLGFAVLATGMLWRGVRPLVRVGERAGEDAKRPPAESLGALYGLPVEKRGAGTMVLSAVCVQAAAIAAVLGFFGYASLLLAVWLLWMMARMRAMGISRGSGWAWGGRGFSGVAVAAVLSTLFFLLPPGHGGLGGLTEGNDRPRGGGADGEARRRENSDGYAGIILLPPPVKKARIVAPKPRTALFAAARSEPLAIPFDGAYWYFKAPAKRPSGRAHVARGRATEVNVRSSDRYPLLMEAHQPLGTTIDLDCCREIEVALTNADTRPGTIGIGIILTDTTSPARPHELLGVKTIASSDLAEIPAGRQPVDETIRFAIPRGLKQCDEIAVVFLPSRERERTGAKVSVRSFLLLPR